VGTNRHESGGFGVELGNDLGNQFPQPTNLHIHRGKPGIPSRRILGTTQWPVHCRQLQHSVNRKGDY